MAGAGAEARAARLQHLDGLLEMPRPEEFDQVATPCPLLQQNPYPDGRNFA